jgi:hypothetical protein
MSAHSDAELHTKGFIRQQEKVVMKGRYGATIRAAGKPRQRICAESLAFRRAVDRRLRTG